MTLVLLILSCNIKQDKESIHRQNKVCKIIDSLTQRKYCISYDSLNRKYREGEYIDDYAVGLHYFYDTLGRLTYIREYILTKDYHLESIQDTTSKNWLNQVYKFDTTGKIILSQCNFYQIKSDKDTIVIGETFKAKIFLRNIYNEKSSYELLFTVPDDTSLITTVNVDTLPYLYYYKPLHLGDYEVNGIVYEIKLLDSLSGKSRFRRMYFKKSYYVKK